MREDRISKMEEYIRDKKFVSLDELCVKFDVSKNTVRRDINEIIDRSDIKKIYGGVSIQYNKVPPPFAERLAICEDLKDSIGRSAADFVEDGDVIYVDSGTTTCRIVDHLASKKDITLITNSLDVVNRAVEYPEINVISLSGTLSRKTLSFTGPSTIEALQGCNIRKAFMASNGLTVQNGATQSTSIEFAIKKNVVARSDMVFLMIESRKFGTVSMLTYCELNEIDTTITDRMPPKELADAFISQGGSIVLTDRK